MMNHARSWYRAITPVLSVSLLVVALSHCRNQDVAKSHASDSPSSAKPLPSPRTVLTQVFTSAQPSDTPQSIALRLRQTLSGQSNKREKWMDVAEKDLRACVDATTRAKVQADETICGAGGCAFVLVHASLAAAEELDSARQSTQACQWQAETITMFAYQTTSAAKTVVKSDVIVLAPPEGAEGVSADSAASTGMAK